ARLELPKEDVGLVLVQEFPDLGAGHSGELFVDTMLALLLERDAVEEELSDGGVAPAVLIRISNAKTFPFGQEDFTRALNLKEEHIDGVRVSEDGSIGGEGSGVDAGPVGVGNQLSAVNAAREDAVTRLHPRL